MTRGVVQQQVKEFDHANARKVTGILPGQLFVVKYVDPKGVVSNGLVIRAGNHFYTSDEVLALGASLEPPNDWLARALERAYVKLRSMLPGAASDSAGGVKQESVPAADTVEVD